MAKLVSQIYGEALFEAAMDTGAEKASELMDEIEALRVILADNPGFDVLMEHPGIPKQEKLQVAETCFAGRVSNELTNFMKLVISKERYNELPAIFDYFIKKVKGFKKIGSASVTTAVELTAVQKNAVRAKLLETAGFHDIEIQYKVDESIIGGMIIRIEDRVVDSSIRTRIDNLKKQLLQIRLG